jgi:hypothetical protein
MTTIKRTPKALHIENQGPATAVRKGSTSGAR